MVFIVCGGNEFQGALDKVWKLNDILMKEPAKVHQNAINYNIETVNKNTTVQSWQATVNVIVIMLLIPCSLANHFISRKDVGIPLPASLSSITN